MGLAKAVLYLLLAAVGGVGVLYFVVVPERPREIATEEDLFHSTGYCPDTPSRRVKAIVRLARGMEASAERVFRIGEDICRTNALHDSFQAKRRQLCDSQESAIGCYKRLWKTADAHAPFDTTGLLILAGRGLKEANRGPLDRREALFQVVDIELLTLEAVSGHPALLSDPRFYGIDPARTPDPDTLELLDMTQRLIDSKVAYQLLAKIEQGVRKLETGIPDGRTIAAEEPDPSSARLAALSERFRAMAARYDYPATSAEEARRKMVADFTRSHPEAAKGFEKADRLAR